MGAGPKGRVARLGSKLRFANSNYTTVLCFQKGASKGKDSSITWEEGMCRNPWNQLLDKVSPMHVLITWQSSIVKPNVLH